MTYILKFLGLSPVIFVIGSYTTRRILGRLGHSESGLFVMYLSPKTSIRDNRKSMSGNKNHTFSRASSLRRSNDD